MCVCVYVVWVFESVSVFCVCRKRQRDTITITRIIQKYVENIAFLFSLIYTRLRSHFVFTLILSKRFRFR